MFLIDGTSDYDDACERLARLMHNIESGVETYEWRAGGGAAAPPAAGRAPRETITLEVPSETAGAPAVDYGYRPAVGVVYLDPRPRLALIALIRRIVGLLQALPAGHLSGYHPIEGTPNSVLYAKRRYAAGYAVTSSPSWGRAPAPQKKLGLYPARQYHLIQPWSERAPQRSETASCHSSSDHAAFTWYFVPFYAALKLMGRGSVCDSMAVFNSLVASVYFDTARGGGERPEGFLPKLEECCYGAPIPSGIRRVFTLRGRRPSLASILLIARRGRLSFWPLARHHLWGFSAPTRRPSRALWEKAEAETAEAKKEPGPARWCLAGAACALCGVLLWGDRVYFIEPLKAGGPAVCEWCYGDKRLEGKRLRGGGKAPKARAALSGSKWAFLLPLLEAEVVVAHSCARDDSRKVRLPVVVLRLRSGELVALVGGQDPPTMMEIGRKRAYAPPLCSLFSEFAAFRCPAVEWPPSGIVFLDGAPPGLAGGRQ